MRERERDHINKKKKREKVLLIERERERVSKRKKSERALSGM